MNLQIGLLSLTPLGYYQNEKEQYIKDAHRGAWKILSIQQMLAFFFK